MVRQRDSDPKPKPDAGPTLFAKEARPKPETKKHAFPEADPAPATAASNGGEKQEVKPEPPMPPPVTDLAPSPNGSTAVATVGWFDQFWGLYWRKTSKNEARKEFLKMVTTEEMWTQVRAAIGMQLPAMLSREVQMRPEAATWLRKGRMWDESSPPPSIQPASVHERNQQRRENVNALSKILRGKTRP
jgi:hypothetical protein